MRTGEGRFVSSGHHEARLKKALADRANLGGAASNNGFRLRRRERKQCGVDGAAEALFRSHQPMLSPRQDSPRLGRLDQTYGRT